MSTHLPFILEGRRYTLHGIDFREFCYTIRSNSADAVITAPRWDKNVDLRLAEDLAQFSVHVLRPGGHFLVIAMENYFGDVVPCWEQYLFRRQTLSFELAAKDGKKPERWPIVWMTKYDDPVDQVRAKLTFPDSEECFHKHGTLATAAGELVKRFTHPGEVIMDPICGEGSVGIPAVMMGRRYIGMDADKEELKRASRSLTAVGSGENRGLVEMY